MMAWIWSATQFTRRQVVGYAVPLAALMARLVNAAPIARAKAHLAQGFRVGDVTQCTAILWTRITKSNEPHWNGTPPNDKENKTREFVHNDPIPVEDREGAVPGAKGQVRLYLSVDAAQLPDARPTEWFLVDELSDFTHQFALSELVAGTKYYLRVEARTEEGEPVLSPIGSFTTPVAPDVWQDVRFAVSTCQMYYHRDLPDGFRIYPAMAKLNLNFHATAGDNVYLDRDNPRANSMELCRFHWERMYGLPQLVRFYEKVPGYWLKDDHDTFFDDCWPGVKAPWIEPLTYEQGVQVYREQVPIGKDLFRTVRWGKGLQVWFTEVRDFRSPHTMKDGPDKTVWGKEQKEWLFRTINESNADFRVLISPTAMVGPDNPGQADSHANQLFAHEGREFREWAKTQQNFYVCCGDRHWQYQSKDPDSGLREFGCGPASDEHAFNGPGMDPKYHSFYRNKGGFLSAEIAKLGDGESSITFRFHDVNGEVLHEFRDTRAVTDKQA